MRLVVGENGKPKSNRCDRFKSKCHEPTTEIKYLNQKVERLMMITEALWIILKETNNFTDEILKQKSMRLI